MDPLEVACSSGCGFIAQLVEVLQRCHKGCGLDSFESFSFQAAFLEIMVALYT